MFEIQKVTSNAKLSKLHINKTPKIFNIIIIF